MGRPASHKQDIIFWGDLNWKWYKVTCNMSRNDQRMVTVFITGYCRLSRHIGWEENEIPLRPRENYGPMIFKREKPPAREHSTLYSQ